MRGSPTLRYIATLLVLGAVASCRFGERGTTGAGATPQKFSRSHAALGTTFRLTAYAPDATVAEVALRAAVERLDALDGLLNTDRPDSDVSALNAAAPGTAVRVSDDLFLVLAEAQRLAGDTDGAFDVTIGPYVDLWRRAAAAQTGPTAAELANTKLRVGWRNLRLDAIEHTATLLLPGMRVDLSGLAHGYAADEAMRELRRYGCERAGVAGGDVRVVGTPPPGKTGWMVGLRETSTPKGPKAMELRNAAAAFSPNARPAAGSAGSGGRGESLLIHPATGRILADRPTVVVFSQRGGAAAQSFAVAAAVVGDPASPVLTRAARGARYQFGSPPRKRSG